jgi:isopentenyl-diphosphate delta-isomerase
MPLEETEEQFEIFTEAGVRLGLAPRSEVHRLGLWHKSAQVFLFDGEGHLVLQQRVADKDVCGGLWDQSAAEHLKPGESYRDGARRGLAEELGVLNATLHALGPPFSGRLDQPALGIHDYELQQAFRADWSGPLLPEPTEVAAVRALTLEDLAAWIQARRSDFTPWFLRDVYRCGILPPDRRPDQLA